MVYGQGDHVVRGTFFLQRLGVTRASDPPCCLGSQAFVLLKIIEIDTKRDGSLHAATKISPNVLLSGRY